MSSAVLPGGRPSDAEQFTVRAQAYRGELLAYCYRMLGSIHDAEDVVQETYLQAWRAYAGFEGRSSIRTWLYRIASRLCLKELAGNGRRVTPSGLAAPADPAAPPAGAAAEVSWLGPAPDGAFADAAVVAEGRASMRLAFVAALQHLPARQRAVLILREVLAWRANEVADLLGTTTAAVNSALQRARAQLDEVAPDPDELAEPTDPAQRTLLDRYATAFQNADVAELTRLLSRDAVWEMPPLPTWYAGRRAVVGFLGSRILARGVHRLQPTYANGQPAFATYLRDGDVFRAHALQVLTVGRRGVTRVSAYLDPDLFGLAGLPPLVR
ncbi:sigma-70 family RNA polymerase sigma factor [Hamadaea tsunoensis]|uniref:sigma-70 family RNA polymerase sigma factor n=1 Tax=Hamadaea tsunoensis TaxID=53368 RepID=UPI00041E02AA|nr:sigma-70 family RNA polymerase sigma factor [Hamadaea tsunoensis]